VHHLLNPFRGPLTAEEIERIEQGVNVLFVHLFSHHTEVLEEGLQLDLAHKIHGYIDLAEHVNQSRSCDWDVNHNPNFAHDLVEQMRALLALVNAYYHKLN